MKYEDSGVDIDRANRAKAAIAKRIRSTWGPQVLSKVGAFGGLFAVPESYREPVLVSSMDGVGTKLLVAAMAGRYDTVGQDLVNHCVNDILVQGAKPLFFLDYIASGRMDPRVTQDLIEGLSIACAENGCALIGGETAEMPGVYDDGDFDLAGCIVGVVDKSDIIDGGEIVPGDAVVGLASNGLHTNGYSLVRKLFFDTLRLRVDDQVDELRATVGEELLRVHRSYLKPVSALMKSVRIKGLAHVTGGGIVENFPRILPKGCAARIRKGSWPVPPIFTFIQSRGAVDEAEMLRVFNMGLGMLVVVGADDREKARSHGAEAIHVVGEITRGNGRVEMSSSRS
jgi:phosphoribosylformylglycinamidine cyclo-ligase